MSTVIIKNGTYRNQPVNNVTFNLVKGYQTGAKGGYVTVKSDGFFGPDLPEVVRVNVSSIADLEFTTESTPVGEFVTPVAIPHVRVHNNEPVESDEEVIARID